MVIYSELSHSTWWFSIVFCMFTRGYCNKSHHNWANGHCWTAIIHPIWEFPSRAKNLVDHPIFHTRGFLTKSFISPLYHVLCKSPFFMAKNSYILITYGTIFPKIIPGFFQSSLRCWFRWPIHSNYHHMFHVTIVDGYPLIFTSI